MRSNSKKGRIWTRRPAGIGLSGNVGGVVGFPWRFWSMAFRHVGRFEWSPDAGSDSLKDTVCCQNPDHGIIVMVTRQDVSFMPFGTVPMHSSRTWVVQPGNSLCSGLVNPWYGEPPTGEPFAGKPHVRFGGRGDRVIGLSYPYPGFKHTTWLSRFFVDIF